MISFPSDVRLILRSDKASKATISSSPNAASPLEVGKIQHVKEYHPRNCNSLDRGAIPTETEVALRKNLVTPSVKEDGLWDDARDLQKDDGAAEHGRKGGGGADEDDSIYLRLVLVNERAK